MEAAIRVRELSVGYGPKVVLDRLTFDLAAHRTTVVLGPGGSGKSTLLRALRGGDDSGHSGWRQGELAVLDAPPCLLPQKSRLRQATVADLLTPREASGHDCSLVGCCPLLDCARSPLAADAEPCLDLLERVWRCAPDAANTLASVRDAPLVSLPRWLVRLAEFTAVMACASPVALFDEPDADLDERRRSWIEGKLCEVRGAKTVVAVTHNLRFARAIADAVILLIDGEIVESATAERFFRRPAHPRTQQFLRLGS